MSVKIKAIDTKNRELIVEIDASKTKNLGAARAAIDKIAAENGLFPHTITKNFPIFNKHKGLPNELQFDIHDLIVEKTELEQKAARDRLRQIKTNSGNARWLTLEVVAQLIEIINQERNQNPNSFWKKAHKRCVEHLKLINEDDAIRLDNLSTKDFSQYISRNTPGK